jgi:hypothetical protein
MPEGTGMDHSQTDVGPHMTEDQTVKLRQGVTLGRMRYVLGISLTLSVFALVVVFFIVH